MGRLRPVQAAADQDPEAVSGSVSQDRPPSPPSPRPRTLFHQLWGPTSFQGPPWGRQLAPRPRRQDWGRASTRGQGRWASAGSQKQDQSKFRARGLGPGSGSWLMWTGGCRGAGPTRWKALSFCTCGSTTAKRPGPTWRRSPTLGRGPGAPVGAKGAGALGSVPQRRHGGHVALILSHVASG